MTEKYPRMKPLHFKRGETVSFKPACPVHGEDVAWTIHPSRAKGKAYVFRGYCSECGKDDDRD
jgi:hypothetical protein